MTPIDLRNETFDSLKSRLNHDRDAVWQAFITYGPGTTRHIAQLSGIDILSLRPRATELYDMGLLELVSRSGHEGVYKSRSLTEWQQWSNATDLKRKGAKAQRR